MTLFNLCVDSTTTPFPDEFIPYSEYIKNIQGTQDNTYEDEDGSGSESEEEHPGIPVVGGTRNIELKDTSQDTVNQLIELLTIQYEPTYSNKDPVPKKVTDDKFKIKEALGDGERSEKTIEYFEKIKPSGVFALATLAGYLDIALVKHLCFTWICHNLNTLKTTREKMNFVGLSPEVEEPDFETILHINLKTGEIPEKTTTATASGASK